MKTKTATKEQMDRLTALYGAEAAKISPRRCGVCARPFDDCYCGETAERSSSEPSHPPLTAYQAYRASAPYAVAAEPLHRTSGGTALERW